MKFFLRAPIDFLSRLPAGRVSQNGRTSGPIFKGKRKEHFLLINGMVGIVFLVLLTLFPKIPSRPSTPVLLTAARNMELTLREIRIFTAANQINRDNPEDHLQTGLIGPEWSDLTTTIGDPEAKRTTVNPSFAALVARLLIEAGVKKGDTIAIGSSGSFPALMIASLSAAKALEVHPLVIFSFGSSSFGASNPDFNIWDIYRLMLETGNTPFRPVAASMGGEDDTGSEFPETLNKAIKYSLDSAAIPLIGGSDLQKNIQQRATFYFDGHPGRIKAFINAGGSYANIGSSTSILHVKPGLVRKAPMPEPAKQGMIHLMLGEKVPVIHLLFIKGICQKYGIPWDPATRPSVEKDSDEYNDRQPAGSLLISLAGLLWFIGMLATWGMLYNRR